MKPKIIQTGAEAVITLQNNQILKNRIKKSYRLEILDTKLRKSRTKAEAKIITKLQNIIPVPKIIETDNKEKIIMEYIDGKKLSDYLEKEDYKKICKQIGETLAKLHNQDIIHGDLTTSNMILKENKVYLIDFGLSFHSHKIEDKAVDLHLLKQALNAKHYTIAEQAIKTILENYKPEKYKLIIERITAIEKRGRYKGH
ncbi:Kae1-associated serine/threonine protein kinase [archaeon]|jgi:TP53 regulating kinase and related kinases|nr:Kae1-associated serine/threonine protein kinase [archaeon]MBT4241755.1 Kae1-associated serine/threonine protein kinase [archaeon]MBT4418303.1 Kae1-associated serine/threonine protein kinase [archaeon]